MWQKLRTLIDGRLLKASLLLGGFSLLADVAGLLRDRLLAARFGASHLLDIYYSAFKIPDTLFSLLVVGALSSAFIPVFTGYYRNNRDHAWKVAQNFLNVTLLLVAATAVVAFVLAGPLTRLVAPGFSSADRPLLITLTRLMLLSPILFAVSAVVGSILQAVEGFFSYAIAPLLYNLGLIAGVVWGVPLAVAAGYSPVVGLGLGVIAGALLHMGINLVGAWSAGFRFGSVLNFNQPDLRQIFKLMIPRTLGLAGYSVDSIVTNALASTMVAGSIAMFNFANNLQFVPISVVGISVATAVFPRLSHYAAGQEREEFIHKLRRAVTLTSMIVLPVAVIMAVGSHFIISLLLGTGAFRGIGVEQTATVLSIFMIGVWAQSLIPILARAFYAVQDTKTPAIASGIAIVLNIGLGVLFSFGFHWGVKGLAVAFVISGWADLAYMYWLFRKRFS